MNLRIFFLTKNSLSFFIEHLFPTLNKKRFVIFLMQYVLSMVLPSDLYLIKKACHFCYIDLKYIQVCFFFAFSLFVCLVVVQNICSELCVQFNSISVNVFVRTSDEGFLHINLQIYFFAVFIHR